MYSLPFFSFYFSSFLSYFSSSETNIALFSRQGLMLNGDKFSLQQCQLWGIKNILWSIIFSYEIYFKSSSESIFTFYQVSKSLAFTGQSPFQIFPKQFPLFMAYMSLQTMKGDVVMFSKLHLFLFPTFLFFDMRKIILKNPYGLLWYFRARSYQLNLLRECSLCPLVKAGAIPCVQITCLDFFPISGNPKVHPQKNI